MLDINDIREHAEEVKENNRNRGVTVDVDRLLALDERRRELITKVETLRAERNRTSTTKPSEEEIARMRALGYELAALERELAETEAEYRTR